MLDTLGIMRALVSPSVRSTYLVVAFVTILAGDVWRYSTGWVGFGIVVALLAAYAVMLLVHHRDRWSPTALPIGLSVFLALVTLSLLWSQYRDATALGILATWLPVVAGVAIAVSYDWPAIVRGLGTALRLLIGSSLVFEAVVAFVVRAPVLPLVPQPGIDYDTYDRIPLMLFWSRAELLEVADDGRIQGVVGNSSLLAFLALLGLIVFAVELLQSRRVGRTVFDRGRDTRLILWIVAAVATLLFTRSATITISVVLLALLVGAALVVRHARRRALAYGVVGGLAAAGLVVAVVGRATWLELLGKSDTLTGRVGIWADVTALAQQRPVAGWGWVGYWAPWTEPFASLHFRNGVRQLHAHNAWLDVWLQLGVIGLLVVGFLVLGTLARSWFLAVDPPVGTRRDATHWLPLLIMAALVIQSLAESRLIVEYGLLLTALIAVKTAAPRVELTR